MMVGRTFAAVTAAALCIWTAATAAAQVKPEGEMRWALYVTLLPAWFDPAEVIGVITPFWVLYAMHDALVKPMPGNMLSPSLAESWTVSADQLVYEFKLRDRFAGWGRFRPLDEREVALAGEALPWERAAYLELFPALRVILLWPDADPRRAGAWWALPYNESDARQRFGLGGEPLLVHLCDPTGGAERFERVLARVDGRALWFDGPDPLADPTHAEWLRAAAARPDQPGQAGAERFPPGFAASERLALLYARIRALDQLPAREGGPVTVPPRVGAREQEAWLRRAAGESRLENRLRRALAKADATLHSYSEVPGADGSPGHVVVEWSARGQTYRYRSTLDAQLSVVASGICLSGRDRDFDLTSLVSVMAGSPWGE
jgi:hypothetical protein